MKDVYCIIVMYMKIHADLQNVCTFIVMYKNMLKHNKCVLVNHCVYVYKWRCNSVKLYYHSAYENAWSLPKCVYFNHCVCRYAGQ